MSAARLSVHGVAVTGLVLVTLAGGCGGGTQKTATSPPTGADDATLGAGDTFEVRVYGEKELSGKYRVANDGSIDFPLVGRLLVAGLEPPAIADMIGTQLRDRKILVHPQVSIFVVEYTSKQISVMGAVAKPGSFPMTSGMTVVQAISLASGFTPLASRDGTIVTRRVDDKLRRFKVPVKLVTEGRAEDFPLQAGDIIYVPERIF